MNPTDPSDGAVVLTSPAFLRDSRRTGSARPRWPRCWRATAGRRGGSSAGAAALCRPGPSA